VTDMKSGTSARRHPLTILLRSRYHRGCSKALRDLTHKGLVGSHLLNQLEPLDLLKLGGRLCLKGQKTSLPSSKPRAPLSTDLKSFSSKN
jgi:hypothetical protein